MYGAVGAPVGHEFLTWLGALDLPDPEDLLDDPLGDGLKGLRPDRVHVALQECLRPTQPTRVRIAGPRR